MKFHHLFFVNFLLILLSDVHVAFVSGSCQSDQQSLLIQLKDSLLPNESNSSSRLVQWSSAGDCCNWAGVTCDSGGLGRVIGLNLSNESISGGIEGLDELFRLQYLQNLDLSYNNFQAVLPVSFANLNGLISLNLSNSGFEGQIPIEISRIKSLEVLDLTCNPFFAGGGSLKLENPNLATLVQNLTNLRELYLDGVNISAPGNEWCQALSSLLPNLQVLSLSNCRLSGPFDSSLATLKYLSVIRLDSNNLSAAVPDFFADFTNLTVLRLSSCHLKGIFPEKVFLLSRLEIVDLSFNNELNGHLPEGFQNASCKTLVLRNTNFSGSLPKSIGELSNLERIDFASCKFTGPIPSSMKNLTELVYLDFSSNMFTGPIPSFNSSKKLVYMDFSRNNLSGAISNLYWQDLFNLVHIDLRYNSLGGSIPSSLFAIKSLEKMLLSSNQFAGQVPEFLNAYSSSVDTLNLSDNNLEGPIPVSLFELGRLNVLSLAGNKFNGTIKLDQLHRLVNVTTIDLSYNNLTVDTNPTNATSSFSQKMTTLKLASCNMRNFPDLSNQSKLIHLDLSDNQIQGQVPQWIVQVGNGSLYMLNLSQNQLVSLPESFSPLQNLSLLDVHGNQLRGHIPTPPPRVSILDYSDNNLSFSIPEEFGYYLSSAIFFSVSNNMVEGVIPESLCKANNLQVLDLSNNNLTGSIPSCLIENKKSLGVLNLRRNRFTGTIPQNFHGTCELRTLDLSANLLEGTVPASLINCTKLEVLNLGSNKIDDTFPCLLPNTSTLRALVLRNNKFHGELKCPNSNVTWKKLQIVDIAMNSFSGKLPNDILRTWNAMMGVRNRGSDHFKFNTLRLDRQYYYQDSITVISKGYEMQLQRILTIFTSIDISCNKFEGQIPDMLGQLTGLRVLNLSHNALVGQIPSSLGNLKYLESLDLSNNRLTGEIPQQLAGLTFLSALNLSYNRLHGRVPAGNQFPTFSNSSYKGNIGLCGAPLTNNCSNPPPAGPIEPEKVDWQFIAPGLGFGSGSAAVVGPLFFWKKANNWCTNRIDKILMALLPMIGFIYYAENDWRMQPEETIEEDDNDLTFEDEFEEIEDEYRGRYCVFCTKLDIAMERAIHDLKCTCYHTPLASSSSSSSFSSSSSS